MDKKLQDILESIMLEAKKESNADAASLYVPKGEDTLLSVKSICDTLKLKTEINSDAESKSTAVDLYDKVTKAPNDRNVCAYAFLNGNNVNIPDVRDSVLYNLSSVSDFDEKNKYKSVSLLALPVVDTESRSIAVILLVNAKDASGKIVPFSPQIEKIASLIVKNAAALLQNYYSEQEHKRLLESFVRVVAKAVDDKSVHKNMHCQKVPLITKKLAAAVYDTDAKVFKNCTISEDDRYALHLASWLLDCGKLVVPEYIVDKATKLETVRNRIHEIRTRFEVLLRDARIMYLENVIKNPDDEEKYREEYKNEVSVLRKEFTFVAKCNLGDVAITERGIEKIKQIAKRTYVRNFDGTYGLSKAEIKLLDKEKAAKFPVEEHLLQDRKEDIVNGCNRGEIHNLTIKYGTLTEEEKDIIDKHVEITAEMLRSIHFPKRYHNVAEYASSHHEKVDGTGYPRGLKGSALPMPARILALADVFEALSADDCSYKKIRKLSEILNIMKNMADNGHIDPDLFHLFVKKKVYEDYAKDFMKPEQLDRVDEKVLLSGYDENKTELTYPVPFSEKMKKNKDKSADLSDKTLNKSEENSSIKDDISARDKKQSEIAGTVSSLAKDGERKDEKDKKEASSVASVSKELTVVKNNPVVTVETQKDAAAESDSEKLDTTKNKDTLSKELKSEGEQALNEGKKISNDEYLARRLAEDNSANGGTSVPDDTSLFSGEDTSKVSPSELSKMAVLPPLLDGENDGKTPVFSIDSVLAGEDDEPIVMEKDVAAAVNKAVIPTPVVQENLQEIMDGLIEENAEKLSSLFSQDKDGADKDFAPKPEQAELPQDNKSVAAVSDNVIQADKNVNAESVPADVNKSFSDKVKEAFATAPMADGEADGSEPQKRIFQKITHFFNPPKVVRSLKDMKLPPPPPLFRKNNDEDSSAS